MPVVGGQWLFKSRAVADLYPLRALQDVAAGFSPLLALSVGQLWAQARPLLGCVCPCPVSAQALGGANTQEQSPGIWLDPTEHLLPVTTDISVLRLCFHFCQDRTKMLQLFGWPVTLANKALSEMFVSREWTVLAPLAHNQRAKTMAQNSSALYWRLWGYLN